MTQETTVLVASSAVSGLRPSAASMASAISLCSLEVPSFLIRFARPEITQTLPGTYPTSGDDSILSSVGEQSCGPFAPTTDLSSMPKIGHRFGMTISLSNRANGMPLAIARRLAPLSNFCSRGCLARFRASISLVLSGLSFRHAFVLSRFLSLFLRYHSRLARLVASFFASKASLSSG